MDILERRNDAVIQSSCDRRTLALIAAWLRQNGEMPYTQSAVVRLAMERLREIIITHFGFDDIISSEDATDILKFVGANKVNPQGRGVPTYIKKMQMEAPLMQEDQAGLDYVLKPAQERERKRKEKAMAQLKAATPEALEIYRASQGPTIPREFRKPDNMVESEPVVGSDFETPTQAEARRQRELQEMKAGLATVPADIIVANPNEEDTEDGEEDQEC